MFAEACLFDRAKCHFVVAADGKSWGCSLTMDFETQTSVRGFGATR